MAFFLSGSAELDRAILSILITAVSALVVRALQPKGRIRYYTPHQFVFTIRPANQQPFLVYTRSLRIENFGRNTATGIEVHHAYTPENICIFPTFDYTASVNPEKHHILKVPALGPKEGFWLEILQLHELPILTQVRSDSGQARPATVRNFIVYPHWVYAIVWALLLVGAATIIYLIISIIPA